MKKYAVTLNYNCTYGFVTYDEETKTAEVTIASEEAKKLVEDFLAKPLTLEVPDGDDIRTFVEVTLDPLSSLENFKTCMTRLWVNTLVRVEWSMPAGLAETL
ncbi:MAG: hypothetical protein IIX53_00560 [Phascolarctobacterium sp.]|jgi:hypothetical protein|nr:hypothetical protein [Phascolarctobacterium sp.]MBQ5600639.1 hypothetical protein [Phascolarctobacterium sp.]MBQ5624856.1 hypothetical protein [Phascolarctobacterium sp.]MBQ5673235.1 hypothetical protein [Phascolarctobacterium sp.]MBQ6617908.1 hypothetical protein [Phascolarctobacterium sp.]